MEGEEENEWNSELELTDLPSHYLQCSIYIQYMILIITLINFLTNKIVELTNSTNKLTNSN